MGKLLAFGSVLLSAGVALAEAKTSGSVTWAGKSITFEVAGESSASGSAKADNDKCTVQIDIDGTKREVVVTRTGVEYQDRKIPLDPFKKVEVLGTAKELRILVDGREVYPAKSKK
jgi:hypothetical protein